MALESSPEIVHPAASGDTRKTVLRISLFLVALTWIVFGRTLDHQFVNYDDAEYVIDNPHVTGGLSARAIYWAFAHSRSSNWHPLTWISHMADCQLFGLNPGGHHFTSVLFHSASVVLLFILLRRMTGAIWRSGFVAAAFAIHPLRVESVAWVAERKDVLSAFFFMLTLLAYTRYASKPSLSRYLWVAVFLTLGLLSKSMLVTVPLVLLLLDYWPLRRNAPWLKLVSEKIPLLLLCAASCLVTIAAQGEAVASVSRLPLAARIANAFDSYVTYLGQTFWPVHLGVFYPYFGHSLFSTATASAVFLLLAITVTVVLQRKEFPYLVTGWFWYLIMLLPVIGIVQVGSQAHADRYTYLPQIGLLLMITWLAVDLTASFRFRRRMLSAGAVIVIAVLAWLTVQQTGYWRDSELLSRHTLAVTTSNPVAENSLGTFLLENGRMEEAVPCFQRAVNLQPKEPDNENNLGNALAQMGDSEQAMIHYERAQRLSNAEGDPHGREADYNIANVLLEKGQLNEAIAHYEKALQRPGNYAADAHNNLGLALHAKGQNEEAIAEYQQALELNPRSASARTNLAWVLATSPDSSIRNGKKAVQLAEEANRLSAGNNPIVLNTLAAAYAETGRFAHAREVAEQAMKLAIEQNKPELASGLRKAIGLYEANLPFHE